jgi:hypothetical protein
MDLMTDWNWLWFAWFGITVPTAFGAFTWRDRRRERKRAQAHLREHLRRKETGEPGASTVPGWSRTNYG